MTEVVGVPMGFKDNLRRLRESRGWSQAEAARRTGVPLRSYINWELAIREPRLAALARLAEAYGVSADELLEGVIEESADPSPPTSPPPSQPRRKGKKK